MRYLYLLFHDLALATELHVHIIVRFGAPSGSGGGDEIGAYQVDERYHSCFLIHLSNSNER